MGNFSAMRCHSHEISYKLWNTGVTALGGGIIHRSLFYQITSIENCFAAWREFRRGKGKRWDVQRFELRLEEDIFVLQSELAGGTWKHDEYEEFIVCDPKQGVIHKATVRDRIVHQAVVRVIEPRFEPILLPHTWSCRKEKGVEASINAVHKQLENISRHGSRNVWILHCDIRKYFASIDCEILQSQIRNRIDDVKVLGIIDQILHSHSPGLPLGNVTSQLFGNVYLSMLDRFIIEHLQPEYYARYCDDFILIDRDPMKLYHNIETIHIFLRMQLRLTLHPTKISLHRYCSGVDWLGVRLYPGGARRMRGVTRRRALRNIDGSIRNILDGNIDDNILRSTLASYDGVFQRGYATNDQETVEMLRKVV